MEYDQNFVRSFMSRTFTLVTDYQGPLDATLLFNCLLGLLVVPKEALIERIPEISFDSLQDWGIKPSSIRTLGKCEYGYKHQPNLRQLVKKMRNAVAHFKIDPIHVAGQVSGYTFRDRDGFYAEISLAEIKELVTKLAKHLESQA